MLTDKTRARLAEDCGWMPLTIHNPPLGPATDYRDNNGNLMIDATGQLTDAGCWQVARRFFAEGQGTMTWWEFRLYEHDLTMEGGTSDADYLMVGAGLANTPEAALMLAIQEVYADQEPPQ